VVREQALVFGEYADVRAGYPDELVTAVFEYLGRYRSRSSRSVPVPGRPPSRSRGYR